MNQEVTSYIDNIDRKWQAEVCNEIRQVIHQTIPGVEEAIKWHKPHYMKDGKFVCVLGTAKGWVNFTIFNAGSLEAPEGLFEPGDGTAENKSIKIREGQKVDYELLSKLLRQADNSN